MLLTHPLVTGIRKRIYKSIPIIAGNTFIAYFECF